MKPSYKKFTKDQRQKHAKKCLRKNRPDKTLIDWYSKKYNISEVDAEYELYEIGYKEEVKIEKYEADGEEWEYKVDGLTGDMKVVPKGTADWELYLYE